MYLTTHSLGSSWLGHYTSRVDPIPPRPSRGHQKPDFGPILVVTNNPVPSGPSSSAKLFVDAPLDSGSDNDSEGDNIVDAEGEIDDYHLDAEEMFVDD